MQIYLPNVYARHYIIRRLENKVPPLYSLLLPCILFALPHPLLYATIQFPVIIIKLFSFLFRSLSFGIS